MRIVIISVNKLSADFQQLAHNYQKMINWVVQIREISYSQKLLSSQVRQFEASLISKYLTGKAYKIALDQAGENLSSLAFAKLINNNLLSGKNIEFIIGGAFGLDPLILQQVDFKLSLSLMTFPHQVAKILLLEQIYRAQAILGNHPYHK